MNNESKEKKTNNYTNNYYNLKRKKKEIFSKTLIARSRRYFFDTNETNAGDYFLSITESKKLFLNDGRSIFKKHKIFIYKEDFDNFQKMLSEVIKFIYDKKGKISIFKNFDNESSINNKIDINKDNKKELDKVIDKDNKKELDKVIDKDNEKELDKVIDKAKKTIKNKKKEKKKKTKKEKNKKNKKEKKIKNKK
ncbi:MAG: PUR family DNA/RNA-binding protein [Candidatus Shikimatogenerans bostrichidophilus]|nr:MAG: PUR family DNA/RNA-binding protein [Candidatus Shikimatogenerans bostrichidophilus]